MPGKQRKQRKGVFGKYWSTVLISTPRCVLLPVSTSHRCCPTHTREMDGGLSWLRVSCSGHGLNSDTGGSGAQELGGPAFHHRDTERAWEMWVDSQSSVCVMCPAKLARKRKTLLLMPYSEGRWRSSNMLSQRPPTRRGCGAAAGFPLPDSPSEDVK